MAEQVFYRNEAGAQNLVTLAYQLKKTCKECPYTPKTKGWIGSHHSAQEFHDIAKTDQPQPCHMHKAQSCVGNALYMNKLCKLSIDVDKAGMQQRLKNCNQESVLFSWDGAALTDFHGK